MKSIAKSLVRLVTLLAALGASIPAQAQTSPVQWSAAPAPAEIRSGEVATLRVKAKIQEPWYIYSPATPPGGPIATSVKLAPVNGLATAGELALPQAHKKKDPGFGIEVETYKKEVSFVLPVKVTAPAGSTLSSELTVRFQACNERLCLPPKTVKVPFKLTVATGTARADQQDAAAAVKAGPPTSSEDASPPGESSGGAAAPATAGAAGAIVEKKGADTSLLGFLAVAFVSGLAALITPCVFPMIPITVSLFTKAPREGQKGWGLAGPVAYCAGIIGTFTLLGLVASALFGAAGITRFAAHPVLNIALALLFVGLSLNLFGVFEIVVPASILNRFQGKRDNSLLTPLLMGLVFTLTSFTCTVPFVGTALVSAASGGPLRPALGMLVFSTAFALPFFLLALFPAQVSRLPKSGQWLVSAKAFMGFLELAAAVKFLQQADFTWQLGWITRPVFLALWFALGSIAAAYLMGWLTLPKETAKAKPGPARRALGLATFAASVALLTGNNGVNLRFLEGYVPPPEYGSAGVKSADATQWLKDDYDSAVARAKATGKPLLINFTGYACTNCRYMERNVLPAPEVASELSNFVPLFLHTDGPDEKSRINSQLQQEKIGTVAIPVYAVVTPEGMVKGKLEGLEADPGRFAQFLRDSREATRVASAN